MFEGEGCESPSVVRHGGDEGTAELPDIIMATDRAEVGSTSIRGDDVFDPKEVAATEDQPGGAAQLNLVV